MNGIVIHPAVDYVDPSDVSARRPEAAVSKPETADGVVAVLQSTESPLALLCSNRAWDPSLLAGLSESDWVASIGAGYENYPVEAFEEQGVRLTNSSGIQGEAMREHVFGFAFAFSRQLHTYRDRQREHTWQRTGITMTDHAGDVCGIVGLGSIGEAVAACARAFGMVVRGVKRSPRGYAGAAHEVYGPTDLTTALEDAKLVVISVPLTDETRGLIGKRELSVCSPEAVVVNVSRGPVLDTEALIAALDAGDIAGAGLDVFDEEPLPADSPLWDYDNVLITPHRGAKSDKSAGRVLDFFLEQYDRWCRGEALEDRIV